MSTYIRILHEGLATVYREVCQIVATPTMGAHDVELILQNGPALPQASKPPSVSQNVSERSSGVAERRSVARRYRGYSK